MGACRHGDRCSRVHNRPTFSQTLLIQNFYQNPALSGLSATGEQCNMGEIEMQEHYAELSPVSDFREACCRQYELGECNRGGFCNFMHLKPISRTLRKELYKRNKHKKREDRKYRDETAGGKHGGYAGGFGGWSGVGDTFHDRDYGYTGRASTQGGSMRKMNHIDKITGRQNSNQWNGPPRGPPRGPNSRGYPPSNYSSNQGQ